MERQNFFLTTYARITADQLLKHYNIFLNTSELETLIKSPNNFYFKLLQVPVKNVSNSRIIDQTKDYQTYIQKLFIDYFMSNPGERGEEVLDRTPYIALEEEEQTLVELGKRLQEQELAQRSLIAKSQINLSKLIADIFNEAANIINIAPDKKNLIIYTLLNMDKENITQDEILTTFEKILNRTLNQEERETIQENLAKLQSLLLHDRQALSEYLEDISNHTHTFREIGIEFYNLMVKVHQTIKFLPKPIFELIQNAALENRASLFFATF